MAQLNLTLLSTPCFIFYAHSTIYYKRADKIDVNTKAVERDKEGHYIMIKGSIQEEDITIINIYAPNIGALQYVRLLLLNCC